MRLNGGSGGRHCQASPANSVSFGLPWDGDEGGWLGRNSVLRSASDSPQRWDAPPRAGVAEGLQEGLPGRRALPAPPCFVSRGEASEEFEKEQPPCSC